ncbi:hypothetical protein [Mycobacteroides salmoniphilum]|uniref:hypothetical protein n=1 Tax=Mycobacteroides salmoniphilum TaxID=404941 RepID=UPI0010AA3B6F|nr:hypothetical protein [Mycobacteroides salmoniphilum]
MLVEQPTSPRSRMFSISSANKTPVTAIVPNRINGAAIKNPNPSPTLESTAQARRISDSTLATTAKLSSPSATHVNAPTKTISDFDIICRDPAAQPGAAISLIHLDTLDLDH